MSIQNSIIIKSFKALVITALCFTLWLPASAEISGLTLDLRPTSESTSISAVKNGLMKAKFIDAVSTVSSNRIKVSTNSSAPFNPKYLKMVLRRNGYEIQDSNVTIVGTMVRDKAGDIVLQSKGDRSQFTLYDFANKDADDFYSQGPELFLENDDLAKRSFRDGKTISVTGSFHNGFGNANSGILINR